MNFQHTIYSQNVGGQRIVGTIPYKAAEWWLDKHSEGFESYFMKDEKTHNFEDGWGHIPEEYRLGNFYRYGNIFHGDYCEFAEQNWIDIWPVGKNQNNK